MAAQDGGLTEAYPWTPNQHRFLDWSALPSRERLPLTQQMLAAELGVHEQTLVKWKRLPGWEAERQRRIVARLGEDAHEVMASFIDEAKKGSFQHQKTYFEMMGWYTPTQNNNNEGTLNVIVEYADQAPDNQTPPAA